MKPFLRLLLGAALALGLAAAARAQSLGVSAITVDNASPKPGDPVLYTVTLINRDEINPVPTGDVTITLTLSNQITNQTITLPVSTVHLATLLGSATVDVKISKTIPLSTSQAGACKVTADIVYLNTSTPASFTTTGALLSITGKPDLQITSLTYPAGTSYKGGDVIPMQLTWTNLSSTSGVNNVPYVPAKNGDGSFFRIEVVLSTNPTFGDGDDFLLATFDVSTLENADNAIRTFNWQQLLPGNFAGSYYVMAKIDTLSSVAEAIDNDLSKNGNNTWYTDTNAARINILPTNFPTDYWASTGGNGYSDNPALSSDGRYVAFASDSTNLTGTGLADTNNVRDIFLYDNQTATVRRINLSQQGAQANGASAAPAISSTGRYVVFSSEATNLVVGDTNGFSDIFAVDTLTGAISLLSKKDDGTQANGSSFKPSVSNDGRYVVFESSATNLVAGGTAVGVTHIYLRDRNVNGLTSNGSPAFDVAGNTKTTLIDQATDGTVANGNSLEAKISGDGKFVVFASDANNLVAGDTNGVRDIFVRDLTALTTIRVSIPNTADQGTLNTEGNGASHAPSISEDGRFIAFGSTATNLVLNDTNGVSDIFVYDRTSVPAKTTRVSISTAGAEAVDPSGAGFKLGSINPSISKDGRYVTFASLASNLAPGDGGGQTQHLTITNGGTGYTSTPTVALTGGGGGSGATATASISGPVTGINVTTQGSGYTSAPTVIISGGGGADATAVATTDGNHITGVTVTNPGNGYTSVPTVTFVDGGGTGAAATATINRAVTSVTLTNMGSGYTSAPTVGITGGGGTGATASAYLNSNGFVTGGDDNNAVDVFVVDRDVSGSGTYDVPTNIATTMVSVNRFGYQTQQLLGVPSSAASDIYPVISADGRWVALPSDAENTAGLVHGATNRTSPDLNTFRDVFLHDRRTNALPNGATLPAVTVAAPSPVLVNTDVTVTATATTAVPGGVISSVTFYVNGTLLGTSTQFPYTATWTPHAVGTFTLSALATDNFGNVGVSTNVTVKVNAAPGVSITSPAANTTLAVGIQTHIDATAAATTPGANITSVQFYANGVPVGAPDSTVPYSVNWTPAVAGTYSLTAVATDNNSTQATSPAVIVTASAIATSLPVITLTSPLDGSHGLKNVPQTLTATATSATGTIDNVEFFIDGTSYGVVTTYPYTLPWTPTTVGTHVIKATATDNLSQQTSASATVTIGIAPDVQFVAPVLVPPSTTAAVAVNTPTNITVTATPTSATIVKVDFFANGAPLATVSTYPYTTVWTPTATGTWILTAVATDSAGNQGSNSRTAIVSGGNGPTVTITSPTDGDAYAVGDTVSFSAQTTISSGLINNFKWFVNGNRVQEVIVTPSGQSTGSPPFFNFQWAAAAAGDYYITGVATDTLGNVATSSAVKITVGAAAAAPSVNITSPTPTTLPTPPPVVTVNTTQTITADASSDAAIASVEFFANGRSLGIDTQFPYSVSWTPTGTGSYTLTAVATDNLGTQTTSTPVPVKVVAGSAGQPYVYLTSTPNGTNVAVNSPVVISANAGDYDGTVTGVQFYANGQIVGASTTVPYHAAWVPVAAGSYVITAVVTDNSGNRVTSTSSTLTATALTGSAPLVGIDFNNPAIDVPAAGTTPPTIDPFVPVNVDSGSTLIVSALGADADGTIASVQFFANGASIATDSAAPYSTTYPLGLTDVTLVALITDNSGNSTYSTPIYIHSIVTVGGSGNSVTLVSPLDGATYTAGSQIVFSATHNYGNVNPPKIDFYVNGQQFSTTTSAPYQTLVGLTKAGDYYIRAVVRSGTSTTVSSEVKIKVTSNSAPTVELTSPANSAQYTIGTPLTLTANASDSDGTVQRVQFLANNTLVGTATTAPYTATWAPGSPGVYTLTALAIDNAGNQALSTHTVQVTIVGNAPPVVSVTSPVASEHIAAGTLYNLTASASDSDGTVASVTFFANGTAIGTSTTQPFTVAWRPTVAIGYDITALATDNLGSQASSMAVHVTVDSTSGPSVSLTSPAAGSLPINVAQTLRATAGSTTGAITSVQFTVNGVNFGTPDTIYPYEIPWTPTAPGTYVLRAIATDSSNNVATSAAVTVTVAAKTAITVISNNGLTDIAKGSAVILRADPIPSAGIAKQVQFFEDGIAMGSPVTATPFTLVYTPSGPATHNITVQVTNNNGITDAPSDPLVLHVISPVTIVPAISTVINNPLDQAKVAIPGTGNSVQVAVDAHSLAGAFITKVEFYVEGSLVQTISAYPYNFSWTPTAAGTYHLVALAYDNRGNVVATTTTPSNVVTTTPVPNTVFVAAPPIIALTAPVDGGTLAGGVQVQVAFTASSSNNYPLDVQLYQDDVYVGGATLTASGVGTVSYVPTQKIHYDVNNNPVVDLSSLYAIASDPAGFSTKSTVVGNLHITNGGSNGGSTAIGNPPTNVKVTSPLPTTPTTPLKVSAPVTISATADDTDGNITSVEFRVNNQIVGTLTSYPYYLTWTPTNLGTYNITVKATDNDGNTVISSPVTVTVADSGPNGTSVQLTAPTSGGPHLVAGTPTTLKANATDDVSIASVQFFVNGQPLGTPITSLPYNATWTPVAAGNYTIIARATDNVGNQATSTTVNVVVDPNAAPSVTLTSPSTSTIVAGTAVSLAATASDTDGTVTGVRFYANNVLVGSASSAPYTATWTPSAPGAYTVVAQATDDSGNVTTSAPAVTVTVSANQPPTAAITAPANGNVIRIGTGVTITAAAADADGTVASVQIVANGTVLATLTSTPYTYQWNPTTEGVYRLTAVATDNTGATTTSATVTVMASLVTTVNSDTVYAGTYAALGEFGNFTAVNLHGRSATFIGYVPQGQGTAKTYYYSNVPIDASNGFILRDASNNVLISGTFSATGVTGSIDNGRITFVGPVITANASAPVAAGYYSGSILGHFSSVLSGIVSADGRITLYLQDGSFADSGAGSVDSTGRFTINTRAGNTFTGKADPATGFLSGTLSGATSGSFAAALPSGNTVSDGFLRNISTRGLAGAGSNVLIAGFVVTGDVPKQILIRAVGPSMQGGLTGLLPDPQIQLFNSSGTTVPGGYNNDWPAGLSPTFSTVGAFSLPNGSKDAAILLTLNPGVYSAQVSDVSGASGLALVELYDVDNQAAFSTQKMVNISTRGQVGTGNNILIAGFVVNGTSPKKVLVRGVGPAIAQYLPGATLVDPIVRIVRIASLAGVSDGSTIRENDNWEVGNDPALVVDAGSRVGATPLASGSKDAAILMTLPPGIYSAQLFGNNNGTGIGLVEVYEVP